MTNPRGTRATLQHKVELPARRTVDGERLVAMFRDLVEAIGRSLPSSSEVVLHDLSLLPNSIVAIYGDVTGRCLGDPATDLLLEKVSGTGADDLVGYETVLPDGRKLRSSTMIIRDVSGIAVAALCINSDLSAWISVQRVADMMLSGIRQEDDPAATDRQLTAINQAEEKFEPKEVFARDVDELAAHLIHRAIASIGLPVEVMQKRHKIRVVRDLRARGMFLLRDAVDMIASSLNVTRFTIYNYLNEITDAEAQPEQTTADSTQSMEEN